MGEVGASFSIIAIFYWIYRQLRRPFYSRRKRAFVKSSWNPILNDVNRSTQAVLTPDILDPPPEIKPEPEQGPSKAYKKKLTQYVSHDEIKRKELANDTFVAVTKHIVTARTSRFRSYLPPDIRTATSDVTVENVVWELRQEAIEELPDQELSETEGEFSPHEKIEQMYLAGQLNDFLRMVLQKYSGEKTSARIRTQVGQSFERAFRELQSSYRGFLVRVSKSRIESYRDGFRGLFVPQRIVAPSSYDDWHAFLWVHPTGILAHAPIEGIATGDFEEIWKIYCGTHLKVRSMSHDDCYKDVSDLVRGLGGKKGKREKRFASGTAVHVNLVLLGRINWIESPVDKEEFEELTQGRLTDFTRLTQKQVVAALQRGM